ncbi:MAG: YdcF family protein [Pegethrix bostrychoides GSE-TBD4-15B]|jgi:uncharacterized SAM-binding protein YcdF (DUF218 family)|uniref:YdcF family protein n=1 Tax=Pegethrix bostrychoides GSE-TBD4-15B TaxID=2839662 RepID=A0A951U539_9CYAN|nr:YdcF family protein [Pegethrix bostrychoides GSE-TBD4-15B]
MDIKTTKIIEDSAVILWNFLALDTQPVQNADIIISFGCSDLKVAEHAALLWLEGRAPFLLCSGKFGNKTDHFSQCECEVFADISVKMGVPREKIILESNSTNTAENIVFSHDLLCSLRLAEPNSVIAVTKPFAKRRLIATFERLWPEPKLIVSTAQENFQTYADRVLPLPSLISSLVGAVQRLIIYGRKGIISHQEIPFYVYDAYKALIFHGFKEELI